MRKGIKQAVACLLAMSMVVTMTGCSNKDKKQKKEAKATTQAQQNKASGKKDGKKEKIQASGKGNNKSDVPLVVGMSKFERKFNPYSASSKEDWKAINLTQLSLFTFDREGALVEHAIDGETRRFNGENYQYTGASNVNIVYKEKQNETVYTIRLREDVKFGDEQALTADDVLFSLYAYLDSSYQGSVQLDEVPILGVKAYRKGDSKSIRGIERVNDYKIKIYTKGYDRKDIRRMNIPITPLHYYGSAKAFNIEKNKFGFKKGDISSLQKKKSPLGAGAYRFIKYESGIVYYEANNEYYQGCPQIAFIQLKEIKDVDAAQKVEMVQKGDLDLVDMPGSNDAITQIQEVNSSGKLNGGTISTRLYDGDSYAYIGMNARKVCVDNKFDSTRSKNLRTALAVLLGATRSNLVELCSTSSKVINYPASDTSWSVPQSADEEYRGAFVFDADGEVIYSSDMELEERLQAAKQAVLRYLKRAGYKVKNGKVVEAADKSSVKFTVLVPSDGDEGEGLYTMMKNVKDVMNELGMYLKIDHSKTQKQIDKVLKKGRQQIWCGFEKTDVDGALYDQFHSHSARYKAGKTNYFHIADSDLDEYIEESMQTVSLKRSRRLYRKSYEKIAEWAVDVPVYQKRNISIFSSSRINMETIAPDITSYYDWTDEIQKVEMKG